MAQIFGFGVAKILIIIFFLGVYVLYRSSGNTLNSILSAENSGISPFLPFAGIVIATVVFVISFTLFSLRHH